MKKSGLTLPQGRNPGQKRSPTARPGVADGMDLWHGEGLRTQDRALGSLYGLASLIVISGTDCGSGQAGIRIGPAVVNPQPSQIRRFPATDPVVEVGPLQEEEHDMSEESPNGD